MWVGKIIKGVPGEVVSRGKRAEEQLRLSGSPVGVSSSSVASLAYRSIVTLFLTAFISFTGSL